MSLLALDEDLRKLIEPNAPSIEKRLRFIRELHIAGITTGVAAIPLLPYISDHEKDVESLIKAVA